MIEKTNFQHRFQLKIKRTQRTLPIDIYSQNNSYRVKIPLAILIHTYFQMTFIGTFCKALKKTVTIFCTLIILLKHCHIVFLSKKALLGIHPIRDIIFVRAEIKNLQIQHLCGGLFS